MSFGFQINASAFGQQGGGAGGAGEVASGQLYTPVASSRNGLGGPVEPSVRPTTTRATASGGQAGGYYRYERGGETVRTGAVVGSVAGRDGGRGVNDYLVRASKVRPGDGEFVAGAGGGARGVDGYVVLPFTVRRAGPGRGGGRGADV